MRQLYFLEIACVRRLFVVLVLCGTQDLPFAFSCNLVQVLYLEVIILCVWTTKQGQMLILQEHLQIARDAELLFQCLVFLFFY